MYIKVVSPQRNEARFVNPEECARLVALGWTTDPPKVSSPPGQVSPPNPPPVPVVPAVHVEAEVPEPAPALFKRGPGRPRKVDP